MSVAYLVDTDWVIDHFNQVRAATDKLKELRPEGVGVSVITVAELYEGVLYSRDSARSQRLLNMFLHDFPLLGIDLEICRIFGQERGKLRKQGKASPISTSSSPPPASGTASPFSATTAGTSKWSKDCRSSPSPDLTRAGLQGSVFFIFLRHVIQQDSRSGSPGPASLCTFWSSPGFSLAMPYLSQSASRRGSSEGGMT